MSLLRSFGALKPPRAINIALLRSSKRPVFRLTSDDNPPKLMYKGKAKQISNPLIAYA
jgi:hypothetical protein